MPETATYGAVTAATQGYSSLTPSMIAEQYWFHQGSGELVEEFIPALRKLSDYCQFGQILSDALCDQCVSGLCNDQIQKTLLTVSAFTFKKAVEVAIAMETAVKDFLEFSVS